LSGRGLETAMHYAAIVGGDEREVEIVELSPGHYRITMGGRAMDVEVRAISERTLSLVLDNHAFDVELEKDPARGENLLVRGHVVNVEVLDLRRLRLRKVQAAHGGDTGPLNIASPMPGKVVAVLVKEGQTVEQGQGLVVVEAMKMENELKAPRAGVVTQLSALEGSAVESGATLCVVE
jgi:biotin carboxyl carrier protein